MKFSRKLDLDDHPKSPRRKKLDDHPKSPRRKKLTLTTPKTRDALVGFTSCIQKTPYLYYFSEYDCQICGMPCAVFPCHCSACSEYYVAFLCVDCFGDKKWIMFVNDYFGDKK